MINVPSSKLVIVRRGQFATFELLARTFAGDTAVQIIWDRRTGDRRAANAGPSDGERRRTDRRRTPPYQWRQLHYVMGGPDDTVYDTIN